MERRALCLLVDGFEEIELVTPVDLLRRAGVQVVLASMTDSLSVVGRSGISLQAERLVEEVLKEDFDLLLLPGGPAVNQMRASGRAADLCCRFIESNRKVAAICAAPAVLHDAGLLSQRRFTAHESVRGELVRATSSETVVVDGPIITSQGAGTALEFGLELVRQLAGEPTARSVARSIHA